MRGQKNMREFYSRLRHAASLLMAMFLCLAGCVPLIGPYSPTAYKNATGLKAETLALMEMATTPYAENEGKIEVLRVEIDKAYE